MRRPGFLTEEEFATEKARMMMVTQQGQELV